MRYIKGSTIRGGLRSRLTDEKFRRNFAVLLYDTELGGDIKIDIIAR